MTTAVQVIEGVGVVLAGAGLVLFLRKSRRRVFGELAPLILALLTVSLLLHGLDTLEWLGWERADRIGDNLRVVLPLLWILILFMIYRASSLQRCLVQIEKMQLVFDDAPFLGVLLDRNGRILGCTDALLQEVGRLREEVEGQDFSLLGPSMGAVLQGALAEALASEVPVQSQDPVPVEWAHERQRIRWTGQRWCHPGSGEPMGAAILLTFVDRAVSPPETPGPVDIRGIRHDIGNFLQIITGQAEMLADELAGEFHARAQSIIRTGQSAQGLLQALSGLTDQARGAWGTVDLCDLIRDTIRLVRFARHPGHELRVALPPEPVRVAGDRLRLQRVLVNLVTNALDATPGGGTVATTLSTRDGHVDVLVADDGPGVPAELRERVFERYFTTKAPGRGTGLGLALSRDILKEHGGGLELLDRDPAGHRTGAVFRMTLPVQQHADASPTH